jgi:hypothetical protein
MGSSLPAGVAAGDRGSRLTAVEVNDPEEFPRARAGKVFGIMRSLAPITGH